MKGLWVAAIAAVIVIAGLCYLDLAAIKQTLVDWKDAAPATAALTAVVSAIVALLVFNYTRAVNRRRATLDMVMKTLMDDAVQAKYRAFKTLIRKDQDPNDCFKIKSLAAPAAIGTPDRISMLHQLNIYELMALGINRGVFDEAFYKRWYHNAFIVDFEGSREFIEEMQKK